MPGSSVGCGSARSAPPPPPPLASVLLFRLASQSGGVLRHRSQLSLASHFLPQFEAQTGLPPDFARARVALALALSAGLAVSFWRPQQVGHGEPLPGDKGPRVLRLLQKK